MASSRAADLGDFEREVAQVRPLLAAALADQAGLELEDKRYSLAVHYRHARHKRTARATITRAVSRLPGLMRVVPGKLVVNVVPSSAAHKGAALLNLWTLAGVSAALYVGDDATDEDVFRLDQPGRLVTARIGASKTSSAGYTLRDQREMDALLARLVGLRAERERP